VSGGVAEVPAAGPRIRFGVALARRVSACLLAAAFAGGLAGAAAGADSGRRAAPEADTAPAWSPDGRRIAFTSTRDGNAEIYVVDANGTALRRLTSDAADDFAPAWSPDGRRIAFTSTRDGNAELYLGDANGGAAQRLTRSPAGDHMPAWSPDGSRIAFASRRRGTFDLYVMDAAGRHVRRLTRAPGNGEPLGGIKVVAESGWFAARPSGTEDVYKLYAESFAGPDALAQIQDEAQQVLDEVLKEADGA